MKVERFLWGAAALAATTGPVLLLPGMAGAAFLGGNGVIAFISTRSGGTPLVWTVNPATAASGGYTSSADQSAATQLTNDQSTDAEPFFSPDGATVVFSSEVPTNAAANNYNWKIFAVPYGTSCPAPTGPNWSDCRTLISQPSTDTVDNDYAPSVSPDGKTVLFERFDASGNGSLWTVPLTGGSATLLYSPSPSIGLQQPSTSDFSDSRALYDPADPTKVIFVSANQHIELISGVGPGFNPAQNPVDLSAATGITGNQQDANPDWSRSGGRIVFDSNRANGRQIWTLDPTATPGHPVAAAPVFATPQSGADTEPVFSPDGQYIAYVAPGQSRDVNDEMVVPVSGGADQASGSPNDLTKVTSGAPVDSQPNWQPVQPQGNLPEAPWVVALPLAAGGIFGGAALFLRRRRIGINSL